MILPVNVVPTVNLHKSHQGEWDSAPIPDSSSFLSLKDANAKPTSKAPVAKVSVVTDSKEGFTEVNNSKKGKGKAKYMNINARIDNIENAWSGGPPAFKKSVPNVDKCSITHTLSSSTSKGAMNVQGNNLVRLIVNTKGAKVTEKDCLTLNTITVDNQMRKACMKVPNMTRVCTCGSDWNRLNNLVISFPKGTDIMGCFDQEEHFKKALMLPWPATFECNVTISHIKINSVPTGLGIEGRVDKVFSFPQVLQEVHMALPELAKAKIVQGPCWLTKGEPTGTKRSLMAAFEDEDGSITSSLLNKSTLWIMFCRNITIIPFKYKAPLRLCECCCSYNHDQKDCKTHDIAYTCCSLKHSIEKHKSNCKLCKTEHVLNDALCPHKAKCNACKGEHVFNHLDCPKKKEYRQVITSILKCESGQAPVAPNPHNLSVHALTAGPAPKSLDVCALTAVPAIPIPRAPSQVDPNKEAACPVPEEPKGWAELEEEDDVTWGSSSLPPFTNADMFMAIDPTPTSNSHKGPHPVSNQVGSN